ncbi:unnamed protein product [Ectocarpus sp. 13 AM-2016]
MGKKEQLVVISFVSVTTVVVGKCVSWIRLYNCSTAVRTACSLVSRFRHVPNVGPVLRGTYCDAQLQHGTTIPPNINTVSYCCTVFSDELPRDVHLDRQVCS